MSQAKHLEAIHRMLTDLEAAAKLLESEIRSGTKLTPEQLRRLRTVRRLVVYIEEESA